MFNYFIAFFIFCIVLFLYLHIQFHLKTSNDLELYELDNVSKDKLEEICDLRQPVLFDFEDDPFMQMCNRKYILDNYHAFEIKIRNSKDTDYDSEIYIPFQIASAIKLFQEDKISTYFSENNNDFLQETGILKKFQHNDHFIRPYMVSNCNYDILLGSENVSTPLRYELNYRHYILVTEGSIKIKLSPPKSSKYLYTIYDYDNFEFRSPINPWNVQSQYETDFEKIKCLEITLNPGKIIQIPAYWWYSIQFSSKMSTIACFRYRTYMNNFAISPQILLYGLQSQNIKRDVVRKKNINENNSTNSDNSNNDIASSTLNDTEINDTVINDTVINDTNK